MQRRTTWWLAGIGGFLVISSLTAYILGSRMAKRVEPMVREQTIRYLQQRFDSDVQLAALHIQLPKMSRLGLLFRRQKGAKIRVDGEGLSMRFHHDSSLPPMFSIRKFGFVVDLQTLLEDRKVVDLVALEGVQIEIPPAGSRPPQKQSQAAGAPVKSLSTANVDKSSVINASNVLIREVSIADALLVIEPKDKTRQPLRFHIEQMRLDTVGAGLPMKYQATLQIPKPPGQVRTSGDFGPWSAEEPGGTPLRGSYKFENADLGIFNGIAGILNSTGSFDGALDSLHANGEASVPDFRLKMAGNPVPLRTQFEVLVDGTNGNTTLQPVKARLGSTAFTTSGTIIKHEGELRKAISLMVSMPNGDLRDLLRLALKGSPVMSGRVNLKTRIDIPPLSGPVKQKLILDGNFALSDAKFLRSNIQDQIDNLSRRGQGQPENHEIDQVVSNMAGSFRLQNENLNFRSLSFAVPGAKVDLAGPYNLAQDSLDLHGSLKLAAHVSQMVTGWKRWLLKPVDPFLARNGAGTFLPIHVVGDAHHPKFGLDLKR